MKKPLLLLLVVAACGRQNLTPASTIDSKESTDGATREPSDGLVISATDAGSHTGSDLAVSPEDSSSGSVSDASSDTPAEDALAPSDGAQIPYRVLQVAAGTAHTCALLDDHTLKCWGDNSYGALGTGDPNNRGVVDGDMGNNLPTVNLGTGRSVNAVFAGRYATCAILDDSSVKCWGWVNLAFGQDHAGTGSNFAIGDQKSEMGDALPRIDLGMARTAKLLAVGYYNICVVRDDESLRCWGSATSTIDFPAATDRKISKLIGSDGVLALYDDGTVAAIVGTPPPASSGAKAVAVAGSLEKSCVLWNDGIVTGINAWSQEEGMDLAMPVLTQTGWPCGVFKDGSVTCPFATGMKAWFGPDLGHGPTVNVGQSVVSMSAGLYHLCAALKTGEVKCWTTEDHPVLGLGNSYPTATDWPSVDLGTRSGR